MPLTIDLKKSYLYKKGIEQGARSEKAALAKKLLSKGMTLDEICDITGLSISELEKLK